MTRPTTDDTRPDTIRDAFEAILAFLRLLMTPWQISAPAPKVAIEAAMHACLDPRGPEVTALRDLIQRAAEEHNRRALDDWHAREQAKLGGEIEALRANLQSVLDSACRRAEELAKERDSKSAEIERQAREIADGEAAFADMKEAQAKQLAEIERLNRLVVATANADPSWVERCTTQAAEIERLATALQAERAAWQEASGADSPGHLTAALKARRARLTAELAARVPALFDGPPRTLYQPNGPDGRPEDAGAPADASLEARAEATIAAVADINVTLTGTACAIERFWLAVVRAVDASRPVAPEVDAEDLWSDYRTGRGTVFASDRKAFLAGVAAGRRTREPDMGAPADASRPGLTEEQAADLRERAAFIAETCSGGDHTISNRDLIARRIRELPLRASRGETGPAPTGLTSAMHAAQQRRSVPPASAFGEWPDEPRGGLTCPGCYDATGIAQPHDPRATLHAGDPASEAPKRGPSGVRVTGELDTPWGRLPILDLGEDKEPSR